MRTQGTDGQHYCPPSRADAADPRLWRRGQVGPQAQPGTHEPPPASGLWARSRPPSLNGFHVEMPCPSDRSYCLGKAKTFRQLPSNAKVSPTLELTLRLWGSPTLQGQVSWAPPVGAEGGLRGQSWGWGAAPLPRILELSSDARIHLGLFSPACSFLPCRRRGGCRKRLLGGEGLTSSMRVLSPAQQLYSHKTSHT